MIRDDTAALQSPLLGNDNDGRRQSDSVDIARRSSIRIANSLRSSENVRYFNASVHSASVRRSSTKEGRKGYCTSFCALMDRHPIPFVLAGAVIGIGIGIALLQWNPPNTSLKDVAVQWIGLLGDLYIRALKCIVLPLVFVSVTASTMDMLSLGEAGTVAGCTLGLYVFTTVAAACIGLSMSLIFSQFYAFTGEDAVTLEPEVKIGCDANSYLTKQDDGSVACDANGEMGNSTLFMLEDVNGYFAKSKLAQGPTKVTLSDSLYQGLFMKFIDSNMIGMFIDGNFLGVIVLAVSFGTALSKLAANKPDGVKWDRILIIQVLEELMQCFMLFVNWIIKITPFAIISLIAEAMGENSDMGSVMEQIGFLIAAILTGLCLQFTLVYSGLYILFIRMNPLLYFKHMIPAVSVAFATASSAATLPVSIDCAVASGRVPEGVAQFCLPLGATINMDGDTIKIICSCIWMAYYNGIVPNAGDYVLLIVCATFGSMGAAPVPSAGLVIILTTYATVFGGGGEAPGGFAFLIAIDWLMDRFSTSFNVFGDLSVTAIVSNKVSQDLAAMENKEEPQQTEEGNTDNDAEENFDNV